MRSNLFDLHPVLPPIINKMSDNFLILIPTDPRYMPSPERAQAANEYFMSALRHADDVVWAWSDHVEFVDCGANFARVVCPHCGTELPIWEWQQRMDAAFAHQFEDLGMIMPCCGAHTSLNDLYYDGPSGFARFSLEALNPGTDLDDHQLHIIEDILGCTVRKIWRQI